jgi:plastocyanin
MGEELFYIFGIALTLMALIVAFVGMRMEKFPSRPVMVGGLALMAFLVVGSAAFAVVLARDEHEHREEEIFAYREELEAEEEGDPSEAEEPSEIEVAGEPEEANSEGGLALTSPEEGDLVFEPETLETKAGEVTLDYTNPSEVPHNVAIEVEGETVAQGETVTGGGSGPASARLESGEYVYYCSIPGHREAGMEGELTVE